MKCQHKILTIGVFVFSFVFLIIGTPLTSFAGYNFVGNFYDDNWASGGNNGPWESYNSPTYWLSTNNQILKIDTETQVFIEKIDNPGGGNEDDWFPSLTNLDFEYILFKKGSDNNGYLDLWVKSTETGANTEEFSYFEENYKGNSHVATFNPVPIPGAVWLLGAGLFGLIGFRRVTKT